MLLARFLENRRGGVAPLLAIALVPLMGAVGVAIDYSQANATRTAFQAALDSTALMLSKNAATRNQASAADRRPPTTSMPCSRDPDVQQRHVTAVYSPTGGSKLDADRHRHRQHEFHRRARHDTVNITATSTSTWGNTRLRVALVLDNTGSMASADKMTALKTASHNLLSQLKSAAVNPEDVYVSIVPFSKDVNVDPANYDKSWLRWDLWEEVNGTCSNTSYKTKVSCMSHSKTWTPANHNTWNGCITDRDQNFDTTNDAPVAGSHALSGRAIFILPGRSLMGLSNDWTTLSSQNRRHAADGNTNQAIGLQMGWQSLTASPFTVPAIDPTINTSRSSSC